MTPEQMGELLIRIDERQESFLARQETHGKRLDAHAEKIRALELWRSLMVGAGTILGGLLGWSRH